MRANSALLFLIAAALVAVPTASGQRPVLPEGALAALDEAIALTDRPGVSTRAAQREPKLDVARAFRQSLDRLAEQLDPEICQRCCTGDSADMRDRLLSIACHRRSRPDGFSKIMDRLTAPRRMLRPGMYAPRNYRDLYMEEHRLAWEYILLSPPGEQDYRGTAFSSLAQIGNVASLPPMIEHFRYWCEPGVDVVEAQGRQYLMIYQLTLMPNAEALQAILACTTLSAPQQQNVKLMRERGKALSRRPNDELTDEEQQELRLYNRQFGYDKWYGTPTSTVERFLLSDTQRRGDALKWRKVMAAFPKEDLPPEHKELLQRLLEAELPNPR